MDSESVKAIELSGIVHNATKIGVQDGDCEDLVNLRFKDGSWRASGDGKHVFSMQYQSDVSNTNGLTYTQLYIHTNVYRHILGARDGRLYWFGNIDADGVFVALDTPVELTTVSGDLYICQTGHLLTIIDDAGGFEYLLFKPADTLYKKLYVDENGSQTDRGVYPFGAIHFNWADAGEAGTITEDKTGQDGWRKWGAKYGDWEDYAPYFGGSKIEEICGGDKYGQALHDTMVTLYGKLKEKNYFGDPFLVCAAIKLYDGKYMYASAPTMIFPRQRTYDTNSRYTYKNNYTDTDRLETIKSDAGYSINGVIARTKRLSAGGYNNINDYVEDNVSADLTNESGTKGHYGNEKNARRADEDTLGVFRNGASTATYNQSVQITKAWKFQIRGVNLCVHIDSNLIKIIEENKDIFQSLCIFVTAQSSVYNMDKCSGNIRMAFNIKQFSDVAVTVGIGNASYIPTRRTDKDIRYDLLHSPFYLLREYSLEELPNLLNNPIVDLTDPKYKGLLENITQNNTLSVEASSRYSYLPKAQYNYNGRLHIANYTQTQFHGYPLDTFHLNNHSLQYKSGEQFMETLNNVKSYYDDTLSEPRTKYSLSLNNASEYGNAVAAYVTTEIETADGTQKVCRYIPLGGNKTLPSGDFIEQPAPLLTFPDSRAKKMTISIVQFTRYSNTNAQAFIYTNTFDLEAYPSLNMAYYMTDDLLPIKLKTTAYNGVEQSENALKAHTAPAEERVTEDYPNGLKVSSTNNPLYFPVENTYQVGSSEVVAMMSNSVAVGTGQTGSAPLYIFCKDGVYAMFVDEKGEMAYTNSRVIARDVCNNAKSVTPIDSGVVFTTDRGLMSIAGEQVSEIGQPLEGDWVQFTTADHIDFSKIAKNAYYMKRLAGLPDENDTTKDSMTQTDFLSYLKGSIINYNHNEFELMVSNPNYNYTYILNKQGDWSRRDIRAEEYVNNYPTSYRVAGSEWYQVDKQSDADNGIFLMSHIIKLDSIGFKELHRVAARGYWQTCSKKEYKTIVIPESSKTIELSPATATIDGWQETLSAASYTKTLSGQLYRYDIPASTFERELICEMQKQTISFKCVEGCSIDTDKDNEIEITYKLYHDYAEIDYETIDDYDVTEDGLTITTPAFKISNDLDANKDYYVIIAISGTINLKGDNVLSSVEFDFERYIYGDNTCPLARSTKVVYLVESNPIWLHTISTEATGLCFNMRDVPEAYIDKFQIDEGSSEVCSKYLVIPEGYIGELKLSFSSAEQEIKVESGQTDTTGAIIPIVIANYTDGSGEHDVTNPTFALQIIKETENGEVEIVYEKAINFIGYGNTTDTGTTVQKSSVAYTTYTYLRVGIYGEEKTLSLTAGKYRQRIVSIGSAADTNYQGIYTFAKPLSITGCEFPITYNCKVASGKQEVTEYDYDFISVEDIAQTWNSSTETAKIIGINTSVVLPMTNITNTAPSYITYKYDTEGNVIGFTIPDGMSASMALKFYQGDNGCKSSVTGTYNGSGLDIVDEDNSSAGNATYRIIDSDGNVVWSEFANGQLGVNKNCQSNFYLTEQGGEVITIELPAGTYRAECVLSDIELYIPISCSLPNVKFSYLMDYSMEVSLFVGYTRNTYGMTALTIPDITQTTLLTIPEHTETVVDTDTSYEGLLGLYIFGSYDGRKWALLGHREKSGDFRDIGALVERTDCRFFRFVLAGQVSKESRFDYFEVSSRKSKLNGKIR